MPRSLLAPAVCVVAALAAMRPAAAGGDVAPAPRHVVLVSMPAPVLPATTDALAPWAVTVEATDEAPPASNAAAAAIAAAHGATTVVWLDHDELVIYDDQRRVSERHDTAVPVDDASAVSIALSIKTSVRRPADPPDPPPHPEIVTVVVAAPPPHAGPHLTAQLGGSVPMATGVATTLRAGGRLAMDLPPLPRLAIAAGVEAGPSAAVTSDALATGSFRAIGFSLGVEWRQRLPHRLWLVPAFAATLELAHLDGTVPPPSGHGNPTAVSASSYPYGAQLELGVEWGRRIRAGATLYGTFLLGTDGYTVRNEVVFTPPASMIGVAARVSFQ